MTIALPNLDDRKFKDLVDEMRALIPRYAPSWTNHNVSDPGITLIELFAFLTEAIIYRLNRVPAAAEARFLELLGARFALTEPAVVSIKVTASADSWNFDNQDDTDSVNLPAGLQLVTSSDQGGAPLYFKSIGESSLSKGSQSSDVILARQIRLKTAEPAGKGNGRPFQLLPLKKPIAAIGAEPPNFDVPSAIIGEEEWYYRKTLLDSAPTDRHFTVDPYFNGIRFGNGEKTTDSGTALQGRGNGMIPSADAEIAVNYWTSEGVLGTPPVDTELQLVETAIPSALQAQLDAGLTLEFVVEEVTSPGRDATTLKEAKIEAQEKMRTRWRAVTVDDFEELVLGDELKQGISALAEEEKRAVETSASSSSEAPEETVFTRLDEASWEFLLDPERVKILRTRCLPETDLSESDDVGESPGHVSVIIVPAGADTDAALSLGSDCVAALSELVWRILDKRRLLTCRHHVVGPSYTTFAVDAEVVPLPRVPSAEIEQLIRDNLETFFHPSRGGPGEDDDGWPFGRDVFVSEICQIIEKTAGVDHLEAVTLKTKGAGDTEYTAVPQVIVPPNSLVSFDAASDSSNIRIKLT